MNDYYKTCAFPKPGSQKKKRKVNGWKDKPNRRCYFTGTPNAERHELFPGEKNRQISIDYGFQVNLNPAIHLLFHGIVDKAKLKALQVPGMFPDPEAWAKKELKKLQRECQWKYEEALIDDGLTPGQARSRWIKLIGRNYMDD